ncbi:FimV N-terminal domain-containing protein [Modicisalibacter ilicicola DSM 19980]|uniref:FimV N-terminal domain-containing protein n=1 Tax=Modicisalibacter ilicicola DSM 19980 TaxID=1121942 RepID=A0A1M5BK94_9GAMM|nr:FimV/HubP family polar landmark protein [Halomonas ilicicola]SHF42981.1 FimV N-terminal domain-containing protein [Halomonas ilicicola DSM 19980]
MRRILPLVATVTLVAASPGLQALDLAELKVQSRLDEPLRARIPLVDLEGVDPGRLKVQLADKADYEKAGLPYGPVVDDVQVSLSHQGNDAALLLSTEQAVSEPYLELLLLLEWPEGEQQRQVNLLLDPPEYTLGPALRGASQGVTPERQDVTPRATDATRAQARQIVVEAGSTLWSLAERVRLEAGVTIEQAMLALYTTNPGAFEAPNINALHAGSVMDIPSRGVMTAVSPAEARRLVSEQNQAWESRHSKPADADAQVESPAPAAPVVDADGALALREAIADERSAEIVDSSGAKALQDAIEKNTGEPVIVDTGKSNSQFQDEVDRDAGAVTTAEFEALIAQQEARLAALEARLEATTQTLEETRARSDRTEGKVALVSQSVDGLREQVVAALKGKTLNGDGGEGFLNLAGILQTVKAHMATIGGASALMLLVPLALLRRRQRSLAEKSAEETPVRDVPGARPEGRGRGADESLYSASMPSSATRDAIQARASQAETLNDADVFIAHGRHAAARELLEQELEGMPERHDLRLKLLSVYIDLGEGEAAERTASFLRRNAPFSCQAVDRLMARYEKPPEETVFEEAVSDDEAFENKAMQDASFVDMAFEAAASEGEASDEEADGRTSGGLTTDEDDARPETTASRIPDETRERGREGENVIDYQPPSLESDSEASSDEMDLSERVQADALEVTMVSDDQAPAGQASGTEEEWLIEEIAFDPPQWGAPSDSDTPRR